MSLTQKHTHKDISRDHFDDLHTHTHTHTHPTHTNNWRSCALTVNCATDPALTAASATLSGHMISINILYTTVCGPAGAAAAAHYITSKRSEWAELTAVSYINLLLN